MITEGSKIGNDYYNSNRKKYISSFNATIDKAMACISSKFNPDIARDICKDAKDEFQKLIPGLPFVGGDDNPNTRYVLLAGEWLSFYKPMKAKGYSVSEIARMMYDLYIESLNTIPKTELEKLCEMKFDEEMINALKYWSERKVDPPMENWFVKFIPGDGEDFDYGYDATYCPCLEYFKAQNAEEIAPYFCLLDFPESKLTGTGLERMKTLAQGDNLCDFRFKKGRSVKQDWSTEVPKLKTEKG